MKTLKIILFTIFISTHAHGVQLPAPLVDTGWLVKNQDKVVILDVRKNVKSFSAKPIFIKDKKSGKKKLARVGGHIPGAVLVDYGKIRTDRKLGNTVVQKLIPEKAAFEKMLQAAGVNKDSTVVIAYVGESHHDMVMAARMYWQMKYFGHDNLALLDGGTAQWLADGHTVSIRTGKVKPGNWQATDERKSLLATSEDVAAAIKSKNVQLVDNRTIGEYLGTYSKSYVYARGHIPGAKLLSNELLTAPKAPAKFNSVEQIRQLSQALGLNPGAPSITYCNSGALAAGSWFVMHELMGNKDVKMYDGSMHQWTLEKRPVTSMKME